MLDALQRIAWPAIAAFCLICLSPAASAMRCHGRLVDKGDQAYQVLRKCGQPNYRDHFRQPVAPGVRATVEVQTWYYNFGPQRLIEILHFRQGMLRRIATGDYGFNTPLKGRCEPEAIDVGMSKYELLARCGQPKSKHELYQYRPFWIGTQPSSGPFIAARVEEWTYTFGSNHFARDIRLINGIVRRVKTGD